MHNSKFETPFLDRIGSFDRSVHSYDPFHSIKDNGLHIPEVLHKRLISDGEAYLHTSYETISAVDYMQFVRTGDRSAFEALYFARRFRLCTLVTAELAMREGKFIDDIINGIYCISEEISWALPAHNTYIRDTPQHILPDTGRPVLDLFACETAALLAMTYYMLKEQLDSVSDVIGRHILKVLNERLIIPYTDDHFWWMGNDDEPMCNWTPWCTQNVLLTVLTLPTDDDIRKKVIKQAAYSLDCFLKDYGEDGCCDEGAQYYRHAGLCLFHCMDILNTVIDGACSDLPDMPKIRNIASYIVNVRAGGEYYVNFSDCSARAGRMGVREFLFGRTCHLDSLMETSADDVYKDLNRGDLFYDDSMKMNLYYRLLTTVYTGEAIRFHDENASNPRHTVNDIFYPSVGLMIARSSRFVLAVKAGDNDDNHNHNDTGSFTLYMDEKPLFVDIGVETYSRKTFSADRYDIWTMQSSFHNLPTITGLDQNAGKQYRATDIDCRLDDTVKSISMNIEKAYPLPDKPEKITYRRFVSLDPSSETVTVTDTTDCTDVILNFITYEKIRPSDTEDSYLLGDCEITFSGASITAVETLPITDARLALAWDHDLFRIRLQKSPGSSMMTVRPRQDN